MLCYSWQQALVREEMMEELKRAETDLEVLCMSAKEYAHARVDEREVRFNGKMYDVRSIERKGDLLFLHGLRDHKEESLLGALKKLVHHSRDEKGRVGSGVIQLSVLSYLNEIFSLPSPSEILLDNQQMIHNDCLFSVIAEDRQGPPPEIRLFA